MSISKISILKQLWMFIRVNKKYWLLPMLIIMLLFGLLIIFAQGSAFAPFIYAIF
ncbi:MAG: DUF5989 family protein [bacterium]